MAEINQEEKTALEVQKKEDTTDKKKTNDAEIAGGEGDPAHSGGKLPAGGKPDQPASAGPEQPGTVDVGESLSPELLKVILEANPAMREMFGKDVGEADAVAMFSDMVKIASQVNPAMREMVEKANKEFTTLTEGVPPEDFAAKCLQGRSEPSMPPVKIRLQLKPTIPRLPSNTSTPALLGGQPAVLGSQPALPGNQPDAFQFQFGEPTEPMVNLFEKMGLDLDVPEEDRRIEHLPPFFQKVFQQSISKDDLYPSIKDYVDNIPAWLETNKDSLTQELTDHYTTQLELMKKIVGEFEAESAEDSEDVKQQRAERVQSLVNQGDWELHYYVEH